MARAMAERNGCGGVLVVGLSTMLLLGLAGCAKEQPKPTTPTVTPDQVGSHADKAFEKLKQEERDRAADPGSTSY